MIQSLDVISVNLWDILVSLANLLILYLLVKKFLFKPVKKVLAKREGEIEEQYKRAKDAQEVADANKKKWEETLSTAKNEADSILADATENAKSRSEKIVEDAKERAESLVRRAEEDAELEYKKAQDKIKQEIVSVSGTLAEKMLGREIHEEDHRALIDSFIGEMGDGDVTNQ